MKRLDLKYRPKNFEEVIGQEFVCTVLKKNIASNNIADGYIFSGSHGSGKTTLSRIFASAVLCPDRKEDGNPCGNCDSCLSILEQKNLNYREEDGGSRGKIDQIREILEESKYKALDGATKKIVVFDEAHGISKAGQNALLKELEEGGNTIYIFCTTEPEKLLPTIQSRCQTNTIRKASKEDIIKRLTYVCGQEEIKFDPEALEIIISASKYHIRDCLKELDKLSCLGDVTLDLVHDYLDFDLQQTFFEILYDLEENLGKAIEKAENLLTRLNAAEVYDGLANASLDAFRNNLGQDLILLVPNKTIVTDVWNKYGENVLKISEFLLKRRLVTIDNILLFNDLFVLSEKAKSKFAEKVKVIQETVETRVGDNTVVDPTKVQASVANDPSISLFDNENKGMLSELKYMDSSKSELQRKGTAKKYYHPDLRKQSVAEPVKKKVKVLRSKFEILTPKEFTQEILGGISFEKGTEKESQD